jgi:hypothetical protein
MAPPPIKVTINSKTYFIPILNGDMDTVVQEIETTRNELRRNTERRINNLENLENLNNTLLLMYIQQTGSYPS